MIACNQVFLIGEVVSSEIKMQSQANGSRYLAFNLATKEHWLNKQTGTYSEHVETHRIVLRDNGAYKMASLYKDTLAVGMRVLVSGRLRYKSRVQGDGSVYRFVEIDCSGLERLGGEELPLLSQTDAKEKRKLNELVSRPGFNGAGINFVGNK